MKIPVNNTKTIPKSWCIPWRKWGEVTEVWVPVGKGWAGPAPGEEGGGRHLAHLSTLSPSPGTHSQERWTEGWFHERCRPHSSGTFSKVDKMSRVSSGVINYALVGFLLGLDKVRHLRDVAKSGWNMSFEMDSDRIQPDGGFVNEIKLYFRVSFLRVAVELLYILTLCLKLVSSDFWSGHFHFRVFEIYINVHRFKEKIAVWLKVNLQTWGNAKVKL